MTNLKTQQPLRKILNLNMNQRAITHDQKIALENKYSMGKIKGEVIELLKLHVKDLRTNRRNPKEINRIINQIEDEFKTYSIAEKAENASYQQALRHNKKITGYNKEVSSFAESQIKAAANG